MERPDNSPAQVRWQAFCAGAAGAALVVVAALDPDRMRIGAWGERGFLAAGLLLLGWALGRLLFPGRANAGGGAPSLDGDFFARHKRALIAGLFVVHALSTLFFFPPADVVNDRPVVTLDHAFHYYQARRAREVFLDSGRLHAYDPYFMAGYPSALFDLDVKMLEVFGAVFPLSQLPRATKGYILLCYLSMVFTVYAGCRLMRFPEREAVFATALMLILWHWGRPYASHYRYAGMFDFVFVSHLSILSVGLLRRFLERKTVLWWLIIGPLAYFIHPTAVVILSVPYACVILCGRRSVTLKTSLLFVVWCLIVVVVNSLWIVPLLEYASLKTATKTFFQTAGLGELARVLLRPGCLPAIVILALSAVGVGRLISEDRRSEAATLSVAVLFLGFISAYGVYLPGIEHLEPGRFLLTALFFSVPLAGAGAAEMVDVWRRFTAGSSAARWVERTLLVAVVLSPILLSYLSARTGYRHRIRTGLSPAASELVEAVRSHTDAAARLMIEDGPAALYGEAHLPGLMPVLTGVEQIGGPYPYTFVEHHFATFERDWTMGKPLSSLSAREFLEYVVLYNVRWIVAASPEAKEFLRRAASTGESGSPVRPEGAPASPDDRESARDVLTEIWRSDRYTMWRVNRAPSFTDRDGDRVTAGLNRISIELAEPRDRFLLRFHWDRGLEADAPVTIAPVRGLNDPVPLILVETNGATSITIRY